MSTWRKVGCWLAFAAGLSFSASAYEDDYLAVAGDESVQTNWAKAKWRSPAIDRGDPAVKCTEPKPNGHRVNMGFYGNTPWATMSPGGTALLVR